LRLILGKDLIDSDSIDGCKLMNHKRDCYGLRYERVEFVVIDLRVFGEESKDDFISKKDR
jgi:hypothetical protein